MSISRFERLEQIATSDHLAAIQLGDILSGRVYIEGIRKNYRKALYYYVLGHFLAPTPKPNPEYAVGPMTDSQLNISKRQQKAIMEALGLPNILMSKPEYAVGPMTDSQLNISKRQQKAIMEALGLTKNNANRPLRSK